jgi:hypothetical protein
MRKSVVSRAKPVFIVGNKRSGSTLLVNMLNEHPDVGVTHESDIIWALFQCRKGVPDRFHCFEFDAPRGMEALLESFGSTIVEPLSRTGSPAQLNDVFYEVQKLVLELGTAIHAPLKSATGLKWIGDKKPVQHASPEIRAFILNHFAHARFVHVVRHPAAVVASQKEAARTWPVTPAYWHGPREEVLERWRVHEEWVLDLKTTLPRQTHSLRLEDLCSRPAETTEDLFGFLELSMSEHLRERMLEYVYDLPNKKYAGFSLPHIDGVQLIMDIYRYGSNELAAPPTHGPQ